MVLQRREISSSIRDKMRMYDSRQSSDNSSLLLTKSPLIQRRSTRAARRSVPETSGSAGSKSNSDSDAEIGGEACDSPDIIEEQQTYKSFLDGSSPVTGITDALSRMKAPSSGANTPEDEGCALLNKFLGAQVLMSGADVAVRQEKRTTKNIDGSTSILAVSDGGGSSFADDTAAHEDSATSGKQSLRSPPDVICGVDINKVNDRAQLKILLESCGDFDQRRRIRARSMALLEKDMGGRPAERPKNREEFQQQRDGGCVTTQGECLVSSPSSCDTASGTSCPCTSCHKRCTCQKTAATHGDSGVESGEDSAWRCALSSVDKRTVNCNVSTTQCTHQLKGPLVCEVLGSLDKLKRSLTSASISGCSCLTVRDGGGSIGDVGGNRSGVGRLVGLIDSLHSVLLDYGTALSTVNGAGYNLHGQVSSNGIQHQCSGGFLSSQTSKNSATANSQHHSPLHVVSVPLNNYDSQQNFRVNESSRSLFYEVGAGANVTKVNDPKFRSVPLVGRGTDLSDDKLALGTWHNARSETVAHIGQADNTCRSHKSDLAPKTSVDSSHASTSGGYPPSANFLSKMSSSNGYSAEGRAKTAMLCDNSNNVMRQRNRFLTRSQSSHSFGPIGENDSAIVSSRNLPWARQRRMSETSGSIVDLPTSAPNIESTMSQNDAPISAKTWIELKRLPEKNEFTDFQAVSVQNGIFSSNQSNLPMKQESTVNNGHLAENLKSFQSRGLPCVGSETFSKSFTDLNSKISGHNQGNGIDVACDNLSSYGNTSFAPIAPQQAITPRYQGDLPFRKVNTVPSNLNSPKIEMSNQHIDTSCQQTMADGSTSMLSHFPPSPVTAPGLPSNLRSQSNDALTLLAKSTKTAVDKFRSTNIVGPQPFTTKMFRPPPLPRTKFSTDENGLARPCPATPPVPRPRKSIPINDRATSAVVLRRSFSSDVLPARTTCQDKLKYLSNSKEINKAFGEILEKAVSSSSPISLQTSTSFDDLTSCDDVSFDVSSVADQTLTEESHSPVDSESTSTTVTTTTVPVTTTRQLTKSASVGEFGLGIGSSLHRGTNYQAPSRPSAAPILNRRSSVAESRVSSSSLHSSAMSSASPRRNQADKNGVSVSPFDKFRQMDSATSTSKSSSKSLSSQSDLGFRMDNGLASKAQSAKDMMLYWCQCRLRGYKNVTVENFSTSWNDGMAFCALIHHFYPEAFDFESLDPKNRRQNFQLAFSTADELAGVYPLLDVDDMVRMRKPDWKCVFTYVQTLYNRLKDGA